jgi:hypothetical protein
MEEHQKRILAYCEEDVNATVWLGRQMLPELDIEQALWRGNTARRMHHFEHNGVPVDAERFRAIENESSKLKLSIANKIEETHRTACMWSRARKRPKPSRIPCSR